MNAGFRLRVAEDVSCQGEHAAAVLGDVSDSAANDQSERFALVAACHDAECCPGEKSADCEVEDRRSHGPWSGPFRYCGHDTKRRAT